MALIMLLSGIKERRERGIFFLREKFKDIWIKRNGEENERGRYNYNYSQLFLCGENYHGSEVTCFASRATNLLNKPSQP